MIFNESVGGVAMKQLEQIHRRDPEATPQWSDGLKVRRRNGSERSLGS